MIQDPGKYRFELARELLDDIELSRRTPDEILRRASRLAGLVGAEDAQKWLHWETHGYLDIRDDPDAQGYLSRTGRAGPSAEATRLESFPVLGAAIQSMEEELRQLRVPDVNITLSSANPREVAAHSAAEAADRTLGKVLRRMADLEARLERHKSICMQVIFHIHDFATATFNELAFSGLAESVFESHRKRVDALLHRTAGPAFAKMPAISDRLALDDPESVKQAMDTCRRVIVAFADAIFPPRQEPVVVDDASHELGEDKYLNRITGYLRENCSSETRRERICRTLAVVHKSVCTAIHNKGPVEPEEARSLFLQTYLVLGEILTVAEESSAVP